jgi:GT2 family glycosyltransferase
MEDAKTILILIVNYFNDDDVIRFVKDEISRQTYKNWKVVIVNNGSDNPDKLKKFSHKLENVYVETPHENLGYFGGMNYGLKFIESKHSIADIVIVSNSDLNFPDNNLFSDISRFDFLKADVIGPDIRTENNYPQNPMYTARIDSGKLKRLRVIFSFYPFYFLYQLLAITKKLNANKPLTAGPVYAVQGAFMVFSRNYFLKGGDFNYGSFLYGEEIYVAELAREKNIKVYFEPSLRVNHKGNATTGRFKNGRHLRYFVDSYDYLLKRFFTNGK